MEKRLEALRMEIEQTRERLLQKINSLEEIAKADISQGLFGVVRNTATTFGSQLDVRQQMARHPFLFASASAALAYWLFGRRGHHSQPPAHMLQSTDDSTASSTGACSDHPPQMLASHPSTPGTPTVWDQLGQITLNTLATVVPPLSARVIPPLVDGLIEKIGKEHAQHTEQGASSDASQPEASTLGDDEIPNHTHKPANGSGDSGGAHGHIIRPT